MRIDDILFFDTETTSVPPKNADWELDYESFPYIVQLSWIHGCKVEDHIIRPEGWEIPKEAEAVHGISTGYAMEKGEPFAVVIDQFIEDCHEAGLLCGHNIYFDVSIIKANILRDLGRTYYDANDVDGALYKGKRIDTMRPAMKFVDARFADGRLKLPRLEELYAKCFPGQHFNAHNSLDDTKAVMRCLPVLVEAGIVELKVKEYPDKTLDFSKQPEGEKPDTSESHRNAPNSGDNITNDKLYNQQEKTPQIANSPKITDDVAELLAQNEF